MSIVGDNSVTKTDSKGNFSLVTDREPGTSAKLYTKSPTTGYFDNYTSFTVPPAGSPSCLYVVLQRHKNDTHHTLKHSDITIELSWDGVAGLDPNLSGPDGQGGTFHSSDAEPSPPSAPFVQVNTSITGKSTVTLTNARPSGNFDYHFWVYDESMIDNPSLPVLNKANAVVKITQDGQVHQFTVGGAGGSPTGNIWNVVNLKIDANGLMTLSPVESLLPGTEDTVP